MLATGCLFITKFGEIFLIQRSDIVPAPGTWSVPGGTAESRFVYYEALREVQEEIGFIPVHTVFDVYCYIKHNFIYITFICDVSYKFRPQLNIESKAYNWFDSYLPANLHPGLMQMLSDLSWI